MQDPVERIAVALEKILGVIVEAEEKRAEEHAENVARLERLDAEQAKLGANIARATEIADSEARQRRDQEQSANQSRNLPPWRS
jgi:hypothetical protein